MATCTRCAQEVKNEDVYCSNCGNKLIVDSVVKDEIIIIKTARSRKTTLILAFAFGGLGLHNLYLGYKAKFYTKMGIAVVSYGILFPLTWIWGIVEGFQILKNKDFKDANGLTLV